MNLAAAGGGGGGGGGDYVIDHGTLAVVAQGLAAASVTFDRAGYGRPGAGDTGQAEPLLLLILAAASEAGARVAYEANVLATTVSDCNTDAATVDSNTASTFLITGGDGR